MLIALLVAIVLLVSLDFYFRGKREERNFLILINYIPGHENHQNYHHFKIFTNGEAELTTFDSVTLFDLKNNVSARGVDDYAEALIKSRFPEIEHYVDMPRVEITVNNGGQCRTTSFSVIPSSSPLQWIETLDYVKENMTPRSSIDEVDSYFKLLNELINCYEKTSIYDK